MCSLPSFTKWSLRTCILILFEAVKSLEWSKISLDGSVTVGQGRETVSNGCEMSKVVIINNYSGIDQNKENGSSKEQEIAY